MFFNKKCDVCKKNLKKNFIEITLPVYGYTTPQKRFFCSESHAEHFKEIMTNTLKNHKPGVRTCYRC
ncbi:hypothetical protein ACFLQN_00430 [Candidatus Aenigmatarchaeota archaeon]